MVRVVLLFVLAFPLTLYVRPLRHDWRRGLIMLACVFGGFFIGSLVAYPMQRHLPVDALNVFGTTGVLAGVFLGRFIAVRVRLRQPNPQNPIGTNT
jgi:drug/metabolite transporter (DMT)-like permease